ncbi:MAG TPA: TetR/AcrR family transcriptional regulator C-terminal domain-containing protein [Micromonosporaceae bacterium]
MPTTYRVIADDLSRRITDGDLGPGDRVPSTRQIAADWGVAMATATKALAELQRRGLARAIAGVGTVVSGTEPPVPTLTHASAPHPNPVTTTDASSRIGVGTRRGQDVRERIVGIAIRIADAEGIGAVSMRRIGIELGVPTMSLYRWMPSKDDLTVHIVDATLGTMTWPDPPPPGWRAQLDYAARGQWAITRAHPWLAQLLSMTRPQLAPNAMLHTEWMMRALTTAGLSRAQSLRVALTLVGFVIGAALALDSERQALRDTGITSDEWMATQEARFSAIIATGRYPVLSGLSEEEDFDSGLEEIFETGLAIFLDGVDKMLRTANRGDVTRTRRATRRAASG